MGCLCLYIEDELGCDRVRRGLWLQVYLSCGAAGHTRVKHASTLSHAAHAPTTTTAHSSRGFFVSSSLCRLLLWAASGPTFDLPADRMPSHNRSALSRVHAHLSSHPLSASVSVSVWVLGALWLWCCLCLQPVLVGTCVACSACPALFVVP